MPLGVPFMTDEQLLFSVPRVALVLDLSAQTIWREIRAGRIKTVKFRRAVRVPRSEIERLVGGCVA